MKLKIKKGGLETFFNPNGPPTWNNLSSNEKGIGTFYLIILLFIVIGIPLILAFTIGVRVPLL